MNMAGCLRRKFILATMLAVSIVLAGIIGAINVANWLNVVDQADRRLDLIAAHGGRLPQPDQNSEARAGASSDRASSGDTPPADPGRLSPETPFETRFFTVTLDTDGDVVDTDTAHIAAVDADQAASWAKALAEAGAQEGFQGSYRYRAVQAPANTAGADADADATANGSTATAGGAQADAAGGTASDTGTTLYVFLDCSRDLETFRTFLIASTGISAIGWVLVLALTMGLARVAVRPIAESYEKQKRFITDASHEIKTPLSIIDASCEVVELTKGANEWTESIHAQVERLSALTERLVLLARMDEGGAELALAPIDLSATVAAAAEPYRAVALATGRALALDIEPHLAAHADAAAIGQATELLLDNAMRYASPGSTIELSLAAAGRHRRICVRNRCDELPAGDLDRLFERFYRADEARSSATGGSGIGLAAVRAIAEAHRGRARIETPDAHTFACIIEL